MDRSLDVTSLFKRLNKLRTTMMYAEMKTLGLTGPQMFVLRELFLGQPKTIGDLSKALELSNSTLTGIIDRLERDRLVERKRDEKDRRVIWIYITSLCEQLKKDRLDRVDAEFNEMLAQSFTQEQFTLVHDVLSKLIVHIEERLESTQ
ncbi:MarR family winged helix-turn-helix transcriptional regulator [Paenibacillus silviterrae]|uniref:MarR family winged helix-turn-helix transcriptional regulator n=1 Tax=Paenibacillus silviterrae TaxID=3242194 RepID=UPI0025433299|nr:MarR family transcriptional regulator [Paenibacillus chinjuensis]